MSDRGLMQERKFEGTLSCENNQLPISFNANLDLHGNFQFKFEDIPVNKETKFILTFWHERDSNQHFSINATTGDGISFNTDHLYFTSIGPHADHERGHYYVLKGACQKGVFRRKLNEAVDKPCLHFTLKGFESFPWLRYESPMGKIIMGGNINPENADLLTGQLELRSVETPKDINAWQKEAGELLDRICCMMSFAVGKNIQIVVTKLFYADTLEIVVTPKTVRDSAQMPPFHPLNRQPIFNCVVRFCVDQPKETAKLRFAIDWLTMDATYTEVRLIQAMTAIENLIAILLKESERSIFKNSKNFVELKRRLETTINQFAASCDEHQSNPNLGKDVSNKLNELNRRSLKKNMLKLFDQYSVPISDIRNEISHAIEARNKIIHRGRYYEDGKKLPDLWNHVTVIRELLVRLLLSIIQFEGRYESYFGVWHSAHFPPSKPTKGS